MIHHPKIYINAKDCYPIDCNEEVSQALFYFISEVETKVFHFSNAKNEQEPIVYFDYGCRRWMANRYIGECEFVFNSQIYVLKIIPRFGHELLLKLFEYIYSTKLPPSYHTLVKENTVDIHKLLISVIWISLLKKAFKHGLIRERKKIKEEGTTIRGKFLVRESIVDVKVKNTLQYKYILKDIDNVPNGIVFKAYEILKSNYYLSDALLSNLIKLDFIKLSALLDKRRIIKEKDYKSIKYNNLFKGYKPLVDLSWKIISSKDLSIDSSDSLGKSFFLDMAEVWELFVHRILTKNLIPKGWNLINHEFKIYENSFYSRKIIPDLVLEKNKSILVVDAKYKRMCYTNRDVDRNDMFQIHTYSYYFDSPQNKVYSSLIYPLEYEKEHVFEKQKIFNKLEHKNSFFIEGIAVKSPELFDENIEIFINSILKKITVS